MSDGTKCQEPGCTLNGWPCRLPQLDDEPEEIEYFCGEHGKLNGYCIGCGDFWGGVESFEFRHPGLCDNCVTEYEAPEYDDEPAP